MVVVLAAAACGDGRGEKKGEGGLDADGGRREKRDCGREARWSQQKKGEQGGGRGRQQGSDEGTETVVRAVVRDGGTKGGSGGGGARQQRPWLRVCRWPSNSTTAMRKRGVGVGEEDRRGEGKHQHACWRVRMEPGRRAKKREEKESRGQWWCSTIAAGGWGINAEEEAGWSPVEKQERMQRRSEAVRRVEARERGHR